MAEQATDLSRQVAAAVNRLRLIQIDFADRPEAGKAHLAGELQAIMAEMPAGRRGAFLEQLKARWAGGDEQVLAAAAGASAAGNLAGGGTGGAEECEALLSRLVQLAPSLSAERRAAAMAMLRQAGLAEPAPAAEIPAAALKGLKVKMQLTDRDKVDPGKLAELATDLLAFAMSLDQLVWATWKQVAPKSEVKRPTPVQRSSAKFVSSDTETAGGGRGAVSADLDRLRQLSAGLISAVAQAGSLFAQRHVAKFTPANIETYAEKIPGSLVNKEVKCWRQYLELSTAMDVQAIELELQNAIAEYTETLLRGKSRS